MTVQQFPQRKGNEPMQYCCLLLPYLQVRVPRRQSLRELPLLPQTPLYRQAGGPLSFLRRPELLLERRFRLGRSSLRVSMVGAKNKQTANKTGTDPKYHH